MQQETFVGTKTTTTRTTRTVEEQPVTYPEAIAKAKRSEAAKKAAATRKANAEAEEVAAEHHAAAIKARAEEAAARKAEDKRIAEEAEAHEAEEAEEAEAREAEEAEEAEPVERNNSWLSLVLGAIIVVLFILLVWAVFFWHRKPVVAPVAVVVPQYVQPTAVPVVVLPTAVPPVVVLPTAVPPTAVVQPTAVPPTAVPNVVQPTVQNSGTFTFVAPSSDLNTMPKTSIELAAANTWFHRVFNEKLFHAPNWDGADSWFVSLALGPNSGGNWTSMGNPGQVIYRATSTHITWTLGILTTGQWKSQFLGDGNLPAAINVRIAPNSIVTVVTASGKTVTQATSDMGDITIILPDSGVVTISVDYTTAAPTHESLVWWGPYDRSTDINTIDAQ